MREISVMIVDDEPPIVDMIETMVNRKKGFQVIAKAYNGKEALEVYQKSFPDVLICDIKMPHKSGLELVDELNGMFNVNNVIIMSGHSEFEYARMAIKLKVIEYLLKPVNIVELQKALEKIALQIEGNELQSNKVFGSEFFKNADSEVELKREMFYLISMMDKSNFKQIQQTVKMIFSKLNIEKVTTYTLEAVMAYLGIVFDFNDQAMMACAENYEVLYEKIILEIKRTFKCQITLSASEVVDLLEHQIKTNYAENISGKQIFEQYGYNEVYLINLFKQQKGMTPKQLMQKVRIEKAKVLIEQDPEIMIKTMSEMLGYTDQLYFSKVFKEFVGMSPKAYMHTVKKTEL